MPDVQRFQWTAGATSEELFAIHLPFDPKAQFGKTRAPVVVTIGGHSYRSTVTTMGGSPWIPFRQSHRDAAGVQPGDTYDVEVRLDPAERTVAIPAELHSALSDMEGAKEAWESLSFTVRRELAEAIEGAKRPETRQKRLENAIALVRERLDKD